MAPPTEIAGRSLEDRVPRSLDDPPLPPSLPPPRPHEDKADVERRALKFNVQKVEELSPSRYAMSSLPRLVFAHVIR